MEINNLISSSQELLRRVDTGNNGNGNGSIPKISQATLRQVELSIEIMQTAKRRNMEGLSTGNRLEDLANAYVDVKGSINENSDNSNKHGKFLDDAFREVTRYTFVNYAQRMDVNMENPPKDDAQAVINAEKQAKIFADSFLAEYKDNGIEAFKTAISRLKESTGFTQFFSLYNHNGNPLLTPLISQLNLTV